MHRYFFYYFKGKILYIQNNIIKLINKKWVIIKKFNKTYFCNIIKEYLSIQIFHNYKIRIKLQ